MQRAGIGLQIQPVGLTGPGAAGKQHLPVVHIDALHNLAIHIQQELRVLAVVPLVNLRAHIQPQRAAVKAVGNGHIGLEPIMRIGAVPVHDAAVKRQKGRFIRLRVMGTDEVALLIKPCVDGAPLAHAEFFQFVADGLRALIQKNHRCSSLLSRNAFLYIVPVPPPL